MTRAAVVLVSCVAVLVGCAPIPRPVVAYVPAPSGEVVIVTSVDGSSYYLRDHRAYDSMEEAVRGNSVAEAHARAAAASRRSVWPGFLALVCSWLAPPTFLVVEDNISHRGVSVADATIAGGILVASVVAASILLAGAAHDDSVAAVHRMNAINIYNEGVRRAAQQVNPEAPKPSSDDQPQPTPP